MLLGQSAVKLIKFVELMNKLLVGKSKKVDLKGNSGILNLDLISGMKYVHLLTESSLVKVGVLRKIFRFLEIHITE